MEEINNQIQDPEESSIDYKAIALRLWAKRKYILKVFACFAVLGLLVAIFQTPVYNARCVFVPQSSSSKSSSSLSSLAALAGVNLGDMTQGQTLSPLIYPQLLSNAEFKKELIRVPLHFNKYDEPVSMYNLATDPKYKKFNLIGFIKKYTIGLPGVIMTAIKGEPKDVVLPSGSEKSAISTLTNAEYKCIKAVNQMLSLAVEKKDGYFTLSSSMNEPIPAAELCQAAFDLMQTYVSEFKLQNARSTEAYIRERYNEAKADYDAKQLALAQFSDANRGALTATAQIRRNQLESDFQISSALFTEISKQLLQAEMKVKEDTPILSAVEPVCVPVQKSNSRSKTLAGWIFFGIVVSCGSVLGIDWLRGQGLNWPKNWE